jgi:hypothetical protein
MKLLSLKPYQIENSGNKKFSSMPVFIRGRASLDCWTEDVILGRYFAKYNFFLFSFYP